MKDSNLQVVSDRMPSKHLQYHYGNTAYQKCVFTELSLLIKQVPWFFMCIPTTVLTFGYSLSLPVLRKDTGLIFTSRNRKDSNPRFCRDQCSTSWTTIPLTAIWRLATIFIVPCVALCGCLRFVSSYRQSTRSSFIPQAVVGVFIVFTD